MENADQILDAPQVETIQFEYAGFWVRTLAYILDSFLLFGVNLALLYALADFGAAGTILGYLIGILYFTLMESSEYQATLGKMAVSIKVGDANGERIGFGTAIGRYFAKIVSALLLCIGFMMVGWDDKKQGLHDKIVNTYVFHK